MYSFETNWFSSHKSQILEVFRTEQERNWEPILFRTRIWNRDLEIATFALNFVTVNLIKFEFCNCECKKSMNIEAEEVSRSWFSDDFDPKTCESCPERVDKQLMNRKMKEIIKNQHKLSSKVEIKSNSPIIVASRKLY